MIIPIVPLQRSILCGIYFADKFQFSIV